MKLVQAYFIFPEEAGEREWVSYAKLWPAP